MDKNVSFNLKSGILGQIFLMKPSKFLSFESYEEKTDQNDRNSYVAEKRRFQTIKDINPKFQQHKLKT